MEAKYFVALVGKDNCSVNFTLKIGDLIEVGRRSVHYPGSKNRVDYSCHTISLHHAHFGVDEGGAFVIDVGTDGNGSTNGTYVNGYALAAWKKKYVDERDEIWLGSPTLEYGVRARFVDMEAIRQRTVQGFPPRLSNYVARSWC